MQNLGTKFGKVWNFFVFFGEKFFFATAVLKNLFLNKIFVVEEKFKIVNKMGTNFEKKVWKVLEKIPRGRITTYGEIAKFLGRQNASRAVGNAVGKNPFAPRIPCHRVVKKNGEIGGYSAAGGAGAKIQILKSEKILVKNNRVQNFEKVFFRFEKD